MHVDDVFALTNQRTVLAELNVLFVQLMQSLAKFSFAMCQQFNRLGVGVGVDLLQMFFISLDDRIYELDALVWIGSAKLNRQDVGLHDRCDDQAVQHVFHWICLGIRDS